MNNREIGGSRWYKLNNEGLQTIRMNVQSIESESNIDYLSRKKDVKQQFEAYFKAPRELYNYNNTITY